MPTKTSEKVKLYLVIALAVAAALVAYFSFVHKGQDTPVKVAGRPPQEVKYKSYKIEKTRPQRLPATRFPSARTAGRSGARGRNEKGADNKKDCQTNTGTHRHFRPSRNHPRR